MPRPESIASPPELFEWIDEMEDNIDGLEQAFQDNVDILDDHIADVANPHAVTKSQIGLADADNTADTAKPVSTAQQTALDLKADKANLPVNARDYGALGDGTGALLSSVYGTLGAAQADFPSATALTDTIDWAALQSACDFLADRDLNGWTGGKLYMPNGVYLINQQLVVGHQVVIFGEGRGGTAIKADTTFPTQTYLVSLGPSSGSGASLHFGTRLEDMGLDCSRLAGVGGVSTATAQENCGLIRVGIYDWMGTGDEYWYGRPFWAEGTTGAASENFRVVDCEFYSSPTSVNPKGVLLSNVGSSLFDDVTVFNTNGIKSTGVAFELDASHARIIGGQVEYFEDGINGYNGSRATVTDLATHHITIGVNWGADPNGNLTVSNLGVNSSSTTAYLYDTTSNYYRTDKVGFWDRDQHNQNPKKTVESNVTTTNDAAQNITSLSFAVGVNEEWQFDATLLVGCNNTGGVKIDVNGPAAAAIASVAEGMAASATATTSARISVLATLSGVAFNTANLATGYIRARGTIWTGANAGTVQLRFASGTSGQTSTIYAGSTLTAWRVL